ncbi:tetratricopeptide repeat protein [Metabacillus sp. KIGAM252]|uniref:Tetratricopeptide repeat protein n=1 Tax=Metabacillus flavus TaxID=2823519 RepID=A0ABS5LFD8_9BACI|nr:tetratricopeptide repeat protein [Metabacillus flavus]MBS2969397.1 tetratricopeptide repeat protein [Metabacillus flavus]
MANSLEEAINLVENGEAEEGLNKLSRLQNNLHDEEKFLLADKYYEWGLPDKALELLADLHLLYPQETDISLLMAEAYIDMEQEDEAISILDQVSKDDPAYPQALLLQADLYQLQGLQEVSEIKLKEAKKLLPDEPLIDFALGEFYYHGGDDKTSISYYEKAAISAEVFAGVNINQRLADALSGSGEFEAAMPYYEKTINEKIEPHSVFGYGLAALRAGQSKTAIQQLENLKELDPGFSSLYLPLARAYEEEGMLQESQETAMEGIREDEFNKDLYLFAGKISLKNQQPDRAIQLLREAAAIDPGHAEAVLTLANIYLHQEQYQEIIDLLTEVMKFEEEDPQYFWLLGKSCNETENFSLALDYYDRAYKFFKDQTDFLEEYARFLLEEGNRQKAMELFRKILSLDPANVEIEALLMQLEDELKQ